MEGNIGLKEQQVSTAAETIENTASKLKTELDNVNEAMNNIKDAFTGTSGAEAMYDSYGKLYAKFGPLKDAVDSYAKFLRDTVAEHEEMNKRVQNTF